MTGRIELGMAEEAYHSHPALSSTGARQLLESPARFRYAQDNPQPYKKAYDLGTLAHSKVLGIGAQAVVIPEDILATNGATSTKAAKEFIEQARVDGLIPVKGALFDEVNAMAEAVLAHPTARAVLEQDGQAEVSLFGTDPETGVECRARMDWRGPINADLKSTAKSASKAEFEKTVVSFSYETQEAHYTDTERFATGEDGRPFLFIVVETAAPHLVAVHQLDVVFREMGKTKARRARELFAECTASGIWPGHPEEVQLISPPVWAVYQHEEKYA